MGGLKSHDYCEHVLATGSCGAPLVCSERTPLIHVSCYQCLDPSNIEQVAVVALFGAVAVATPENSVGYSRDYIQD